MSAPGGARGPGASRAAGPVARRSTGEGGLPTRVLARLEEALGREAVLREPGRLLTYESDALPRFRQLPAAVLLPRDTAAVVAAVRILGEAGIPLTPRGAGTGLSGGAVAAPGGVVIGTARMNRILALDPIRRLARVQPGVVNADLGRAAASHDLHYAPDPSSQSACTLGGNVGENAGGPHCLKYGVTTRYVTGLTVVGAGGEILELGGADRSEGLDLTGLFVGSEGCFGLATEIEVRLTPRARGVRTLLAVFEGMEPAGRAVSMIIARGLLPAAMEMMDRGSIEAVEASIFAAGYPRDAGAVLVVEFDGSEAGLDADADVAEGLCREAGATLVRRARTAAEREALWRGRKKAYGAFGRITPDLMVQDATVPRSKLPEVLAAVEEIGARHGVRLANVFHAGDGNLHPKILFDRRDPKQVERMERASKEIMEVCVRAGGTITGEHGVGLDKRAYMPLVHGPRELAVMADVQRAFDPQGLWNPGKVLPDHGAGDPETDDEATARSGPETPTAPAVAGGPGVVEHSVEDLTVRVGGDVPFTRLEEVLAASGQWLPLDASGIEGRTVGEFVSDGDWGPLAPAFGRPRDLVLGAIVDTPGRGPLRLGGRVMKNVAGFDLVRALSGSRGRLGTIREVVFRLSPLPEAHRVLTLELSGPWNETGGLRELLRRLVTHPVLPASLVRQVGPGGSRLGIRLLGSAAVVASDTEELLEIVPGASVWEGSTPEAGFWRRDPLATAPAPEGPVLEVRGGRLEALEVDEAVAALGEEVVSVRHLPLWHVWRATLGGAVSDRLESGIGTLAERVRGRGGDLAFLRGGPARWRPGSGVSPEVAALEGRVVAAILGASPGDSTRVGRGRHPADASAPEPADR